MAFAMPRRGFMLGAPGFYARTLYYILVFYINYFYIVDRTLCRRSGKNAFWRFLLLNIGLIALGMLLSYLMTHFNIDPRGIKHPSRLKSFSFLLRDAAMMILTIGLAVALRLSSRWHDIDMQQRQLHAEQQATELASLKSQLNPHFLFNTLNTIYALVDVSPEDAKKAVHRLSGLLRYVLYEDVRAVRLSQEADFIENYVSLMRLRLAARRVVVDIDLNGCGDVMVPPLLFIPLIENAFKYGTEDSEGNPVEISLTVENNEIKCVTANGVVSNSRQSDEKNSGIGLANLRRRLQLIYGGEASFSTRLYNNIFTAKLIIPLKSDVSK